MVKFSDIQSAYERIKNIVNKTPVMTSRTLDKLLNATIYLKCENFQRIGAFKFRGAYNAISQLGQEEKSRGVITHSSGNHAQAVALSSKILNIKAVIVMPRSSPQVKVNATKNTYKAEVVFCENNIESREKTTNKLIEKSGFTLIHPYDNDNVICGAGTITIELLKEIEDLDMLFAPIGGGGLISGNSIAAKGINPNIQVYGCEPELADDAYRSIKAGKILKNKNPNTIADGLRTNLCERTFKIIQKNVDEIILVSEKEIINAMRFLWERMKLIVEPSGAVPLAGIMSKKIDIKGKKVGVIISGGNIDLNDFFTILLNKIK
ncbi:MAG: threonine ammonia-lyase [Candidatus Helarchaeota archaeon]